MVNLIQARTLLEITFFTTNYERLASWYDTVVHHGDDRHCTNDPKNQFSSTAMYIHVLVFLKAGVHFRWHACVNERIRHFQTKMERVRTNVPDSKFGTTTRTTTRTKMTAALRKASSARRRLRWTIVLLLVPVARLVFQESGELPSFTLKTLWFNPDNRPPLSRSTVVCPHAVGLFDSDNDETLLLAAIDKAKIFHTQGGNLRAIQEYLDEHIQSTLNGLDVGLGYREFFATLFELHSIGDNLR